MRELKNEELVAVSGGVTCNLESSFMISSNGQVLGAGNIIRNCPNTFNGIPTFGGEPTIGPVEPIDFDFDPTEVELEVAPPEDLSGSVEVQIGAVGVAFTVTEDGDVLATLTLGKEFTAADLASASALIKSVFSFTVSADVGSTPSIGSIGTQINAFGFQAGVDFDGEIGTSIGGALGGAQLGLGGEVTVTINLSNLPSNIADAGQAIGQAFQAQLDTLTGSAAENFVQQFGNSPTAIIDLFAANSSPFGFGASFSESGNDSIDEFGDQIGGEFFNQHR